MPNRLATATSPYLLQHADNPVDWWEWGPAVFAAAQERDQPILLSVGYSACHWCHVMAHESFEDEVTARYMNQHFVNVKVDREERPDVDRIYMDALQAMTGRGGWPMTVFLTPDGEPFYAGTYFPKEPGNNMPSFLEVLSSVSTTWLNQRATIEGQAARLTDAVRAGIPAGEPPPTEPAMQTALNALEQSHDRIWGGFGRAPKFPQASVLELLIRAAALDEDTRQRVEPLLRRTLDGMASGGIHDHLGGGFARYSVDDRWLVPHFEKMLYDNALLARAYLRAGQVLDEPRYLDVARRTLQYLQRDMLDPQGGIHSAEDADSDGAEGKYYVWTHDELVNLLGADAPLAIALYGVTRDGNFEGANILHRPTDIESLAAAHGMTPEAVAGAQDRIDARLLTVRARRARPGRDDKIVTVWNALAMRAFAEAGAVLADPGFLATASGIADFIGTNLTREDGRLLRSWRMGRTSVPAFCEDYAALAVGLFMLYQATGDEGRFDAAMGVTADMVDLFAAADGFYSTGRDADSLITRPRDFADNPTPSANSLAAEALMMRRAYTGGTEPLIEQISRGAGWLLTRHPTSVAHLLAVLNTIDHGVRQVAIVGDRPAASRLAAVIWESFHPDTVLAIGPADDSAVPLLRGRGTAGAAAAAHVCTDFTCDLPVTSPEELRRRLD